MTDMTDMSDTFDGNFPYARVLLRKVYCFPCSRVSHVKFFLSTGSGIIKCSDKTDNFGQVLTETFYTRGFY